MDRLFSGNCPEVTMYFKCWNSLLNLVISVVTIFGLSANSQELQTRTWVFEDFIGLFEPGTADATIALSENFNSTLEIRKCHKVTLCSKWKVSEKKSPDLVYDKSITYGRIVNEAISIRSDSAVHFSMPFSQLKLGLQFNHLGILEVVIKPEASVNLQNSLEAKSQIKFVSTFNNTTQSFESSDINFSTFNHRLDAVVNCTNVGFQQICETGYYYNKGRFVLFEDKGNMEKIVFIRTDSISFVQDSVVISLNSRSQVAANGIWTEVKWVMSAVIKKATNE